MRSDRSHVLALVQRHGWNATSFQILEPGFTYWFHDDACVAYVDTGSAWVAAGVPIAAEERLVDVSSAFVAEARRRGRRVCFFGTEARFVEGAPFSSLRIGEQPVWRPVEWRDALACSRSLREQLRRARAKGVTIRRVEPGELVPGAPLRKAIERLAIRWLESRPMAPMGFLVQLHLFSFLEERRFFVAERHGELQGLLSTVRVYARNGLFLEDLLRDPQAPNGTAELLVDAALCDAASAGMDYATLGMVPLAGDVPRPLRSIRRVARGFYDFEGLRAFKAKLRPRRWDAVYLSHPEDQSALVTLTDVLAAFAGGSLLRFGWETLRRRSAASVVREMPAVRQRLARFT